jgi:sugar lactone lactonase YvrE
MPPRLTAVRRFVFAAALCAAPVLSTVARADFAPTTPTFAFKWGGPGSGPEQFNLPYGAAVDAFGNVYIPDGNQRVQKFDRWGNLILQWGSAGSGNGQFSYPDFIAIDAAGNVYVTDYFNNRVQKFTSSGTYLSQFGSGGTGNGQFNGCEGLAIDKAGNLYVGDYFNNRVEKFNSAGVYVTQWGVNGTGNGQFNGPEGIAVDLAGNVYVCDYSNNRVQKFTSSGSYISQFGSLGAGNGQFNQPGAIVIDGVGNLFISDYGNNRVQKFNASGVYLTQWGSTGSGDGQFNGAWGLALDASGNVYVTEYLGNRIQKFSGAGAVPADAPATLVLRWGSSGSGNGQFGRMRGIACDASGLVYVADTDNGRIQKFTPFGSYLLQWPTAVQPWTLAISGGSVYVVSGFSNTVALYDTIGTSLGQWGSTGSGNGQFSGPKGVATDVSGNVYVADTGNNRVQKFTSGGVYLAQWGTVGAGNGQFSAPDGIVTDRGGMVYVLDGGNGRVQKFRSDGTYVGQWPTQFFNSTSLRSIAIDAAGDIYVMTQGTVQKFTSNGLLLTQWQFVGAFNEVGWGVAVGPAGEVYATEANSTHVVEKFASAPSIALVSDVGNDQGGQVRLRILRSSGDDASSTTPVLRYDIFRRIDPLSPWSAQRPADVALTGWDQVGSIDAFGDVEYDAIVPTLENSTTASLYYSALIVRAVTATPTLHFDSAVEYGYSIDNLSPGAPNPFTAAYGAGATNLHWGPSTAADFSSFRLYRGSSSSFTPSSGNLIATIADTGYVDPGPAGSWYKLSAVDFNGNESPFAVVGPDQTTSVSGGQPLTLALAGVWPNPASGRALNVRFTLPAKADARLELLDVAGRRVVTREVGALGPGQHAVSLSRGSSVPPGLYFVRLRQGAETRTVRVTVAQ